MDYNYSYNNYYLDQVSCIDRQIAELEARRKAILNGYCFTGYTSLKPYVDPYGLCKEKDDEKQD